LAIISIVIVVVIVGAFLLGLPELNKAKMDGSFGRSFPVPKPTS